MVFTVSEIIVKDMGCPENISDLCKVSIIFLSSVNELAYLMKEVVVWMIV